MADLLIDTDVLVDHLRGSTPITPGRHRLHYSVVSRTELFAGTTAASAAADLLGAFHELTLDPATAERAGRIVRDYGTPLATALIAATALQHGYPIVTRQRSQYQRIRGVRLRTLR